MEILQQQYTLLQGAREILFDFLENEVGDGLNTPMPTYENQSVRDILEHCASCYHYWLVYCILKQPIGSITDMDFSTIQMIRLRYRQVDEMMLSFFKNFEGKLEAPLDVKHDRMGRLTATPTEVFTHVFTHEFHHKGQIVLMCRMLGFPPPETDVSVFF